MRAQDQDWLLSFVFLPRKESKCLKKFKTDFGAEQHTKKELFVTKTWYMFGSRFIVFSFYTFCFILLSKYTKI